MGKGEIYFTPPNKKAASALASASASASASPQWAELPVELTENILQRLGVVDILQSAQKVCAPWRKVCKDPSLWRVINMIHPINKYDDDCAVMFRHAVNRSQGELTDLTIAAIVDHKLLGYIADRSSHLRRLTLACCELSSGALSEAVVKKLPELEELLIFIPVPSRCISSGDIETIGKSCPMLKSFTYNQPRCNHPSPEYYSEEEEEVSKTDYNAYLPKIGEKPEAASIDHDHIHHDCEVKEDEKEKGKEEEKGEEREEEKEKDKDEEIEEEKEEEREEEKEKENEEEIEEEKEEEPEADYNNYSPKLEEKPEAAYNNHDHLHHVYVEDDDEAEDDDDDDEEEQEYKEMEGYHEFYENYEFVGSVPYDSDDDNRYDINNEDAKAIARTMPNLQHLRLVANDLTKKGLKAILEGCPRLESLDLRMCYGVYLQGKVWRRCCEQIKDVKLPCDSIDEHPYAWKHRRRSPYMKRSEWFEYVSTL